jgi:hypothetical protein
MAAVSLLLPGTVSSSFEEINFVLRNHHHATTTFPVLTETHTKIYKSRNHIAAQYVPMLFSVQTPSEQKTKVGLVY